MALFYRGAGIDTYWHKNDPRLTGFTAHSPGTEASTDRLMNHIAQSTVTSPFISLTRSFGIALDYALFGMTKASKSNPAFVWEVELGNPLPKGMHLIDPVKEIADGLPAPQANLTYHHDGAGSVLLGLVDPEKENILLEPVPIPPGGGATPKAPNLSLELRTLIRTLRDAEVLVIGAIPASRIRACYEVY